MSGSKPMPPERRIATFWLKVNKTGECWLWTGARFRSGYGAIKVRGRLRRVHRFAWEIHFGEIPPGKVVCHRCDTRACVRPDHLFVDTQKENIRDMHAKGRGWAHQLKAAKEGR